MHIQDEMVQLYILKNKSVRSKNVTNSEFIVLFKIKNKIIFKNFMKYKNIFQVDITCELFQKSNISFS